MLQNTLHALGIAVHAYEREPQASRDWGPSEVRATRFGFFIYAFCDLLARLPLCNKQQASAAPSEGD